MNLNKQIIVAALSGIIMLSGMNAEAAMTFEQALKYQSNCADQFEYSTQRMKDPYGEKRNYRFFSVLGSHGVYHPGESLFNVYVNYGYEGENAQPYPYIRWMAALRGKPDKGYGPVAMKIAFNDGTLKELDLSGWEYTPEFMQFMGWIHYYSGRIRLNDFELYELTQHGGITNVSVYDNGGFERFCFYSKDKEIKKKEKLHIGLNHALNVLQIDEAVLLAKKAEYEKQQEAIRLAKMRADIEKEIKEEQERAEMKKQILAEMEAKKQAAIK